MSGEVLVWLSIWSEAQIICVWRYCHPIVSSFIYWASGKASNLQKNWVTRCWHGYLSGASCKWFAYGPCHCHPIITCFIKIQTGLTFLVTAYPGCRGKEATERVHVCLSAYSTDEHIQAPSPLAVHHCVLLSLIQNTNYTLKTTAKTCQEWLHPSDKSQHQICYWHVIERKYSMQNVCVPIQS